MIDLGPLGDRAWLARFAAEAEAARWAAAVRSLQLPGVVEVTLAYATVAVFADPDPRRPRPPRSPALAPSSRRPSGARTGRAISIPVLYDGDDLAAVARASGLSMAEVIAPTPAHYRVFAVGFQPGFPYAGYLPEHSRGIPRRPEPRLRGRRGLGGHRRAADRDLPGRLARRLALAGPDPAPDRRPRRRPLPDRARRLDPIRADRREAAVPVQGRRTPLAAGPAHAAIDRLIDDGLGLYLRSRIETFGALLLDPSNPAWPALPLWRT